jgi:Bacterial PH domain
MSMLQKILGNAVEVDPQSLQTKYSDILVKNEDVVGGYALIRDSIIFTTERLLLINVQGVTGSKVEYKSIPYSSVKAFSMITAGTLDLDCEIVLTVSAMAGFPVSLKFKKGTDLNPIYKLLSTYTLRDN